MSDVTHVDQSFDSDLLTQNPQTTQLFGFILFSEYF